MDQAQIERIMSYVNNARRVWGLSEIAILPARDLLTIEIRSDGYANAHVEGEHTAWNICKYETARECGERCAAAEWVETNEW